MVRRLLVTGGAGFLGANFVRFWLERHPGDRVVVLDALTYAGNRDNLAGLEGKPGFRFIEGNIGDQPLVESLLRDEALDLVVNFAAESHVDRSIAGPDAFIETNVVGTHSLLKACRNVWEGRPREDVLFHHVSTDEVFGSLEPGQPPAGESSPYAPNSPYSASKAASDHLVRAYHRTYGLPVTTSHCTNNYGPWQHPEKLVPRMLINALVGEALPVYGDGRQVRDWMHVSDHCRAVEAVILGGRRGETYNLAGGNGLTNLELVHRLCAELDRVFVEDRNMAGRFPGSPAAHGRPVAELITHVADRPGHDRRYAVDATKAERELGFRPEETLTSGLRETLNWYLENETWWRRLLTR